MSRELAPQTVRIRTVPAPTKPTRLRTPSESERTHLLDSCQIIISSMPRARGRTRAHERETDHTQGLLGSSIEVSAEHTQAVVETESKELSDGLKKNYRNRLNHIMEFLRVEYPEYFAVGVRELAPESLGDPNSFHHNNSHDLVYQGLNVKFIKAFLA